MQTEVEANGKQLHGWRKAFMAIVLALGSVFLAAMAVFLVVITFPFAVIVRTFTGQWPQWFHVSVKSE